MPCARSARRTRRRIATSGPRRSQEVAFGDQLRRRSSWSQIARKPSARSLTVTRSASTSTSTTEPARSSASSNAWQLPWGLTARRSSTRPSSRCSCRAETSRPRRAHGTGPPWRRGHEDGRAETRRANSTHLVGPHAADGEHPPHRLPGDRAMAIILGTVIARPARDHRARHRRGMASLLSLQRRARSRASRRACSRRDPARHPAPFGDRELHHHHLRPVVWRAAGSYAFSLWLDAAAPGRRACPWQWLCADGARLACERTAWSCSARPARLGKAAGGGGPDECEGLAGLDWCGPGSGTRTRDPD